MAPLWRAAKSDLLLLSIAAGSADAAGYLGLGRVFPCNMTGNVVLFGVALGLREWREALHSAYVLLLFVVGVALGLAISRQLDRASWPLIARRILGLDAGLLIGFAALWAFLPVPVRSSWNDLLLAFLTPAMGAQTAALNRLRAPGVQTTAITSTLTTFVSRALQNVFPVAGSSAGESEQSGAFAASVIALYCLGALLTGALIYHLPALVGAIPAALVTFVFLRHLTVSRDNLS